MKILDNPIAQREWIRFKRGWTSWGLFLSLLVLIQGVNAVVAHSYLGNNPDISAVQLPTIWMFSALGMLIPFLAVVMVVFWVGTALERERRDNAWENLAMTPLLPREIAVGMIAVPLFITLVFNGAIYIPSLFLHYEHSGLGNRQFALFQSKLFMLIAAPGILLERLVNSAMAGLLAFWICRRRTFASGIMITLGALIGIRIFVLILMMIPVFILTLVLGVAGWVKDPGILGSSIGGLALLLSLLIESFLTVFLLLKVERALRSDLAIVADARVE